MPKNTKYKKGNHVVYNIGYHIIWCPKYRSIILKNTFKEIIEEALIHKIKEMKILLITYEIMPDHIHIFIKCPPYLSVSNIVKNLKGYTSYKLREKYPKYREKYKHLWSNSYFCETVGHISQDTIEKYINNQWNATIKS